ncbi:hypothetical protein [Sediminicurvatus halobius]|uniref:hypothetical protein n=1 Tax=Sediminicurvatus halobius TaxID=2182432 RepID=UPI001304AA20|nr:hypothetical protein [Spiribacter halobius]UEX76804.1 hypothetical protein LMH63_12650 [Spiribacter halobius]
MATQREIAEHLDLSERRVRDLLAELGVDHREASLDEVRVSYIRHLRELAAGRGGDQQASLTEARTQQALADANLKRLTYYRELKLLVPVEEIEPRLAGWAATARSEVGFAVDKLVAGIRSQHGIEVSDQEIDDALQPAYRAIGSYPPCAAGDDGEGGTTVGAAATKGDQGMAG